MLVDDDERNDAGIEHFEQIFILERLRRILEHNRRFLFRCKPLVQRNQTFVVARRFANEDFLA